MSGETVENQYKVINKSESGHCCFEYTVVDTSKPYMVNGQHLNSKFEPMCECFEEEQAELICKVLNAYKEQ